MTKIEIKDKDGVFDMSVEGHSGYAPAGTDIVCAGISTLTFTLFERIKKLPQIRNLSYVASDGKFHLTFRHPLENAELEAIISTIVTGYQMLSEEYPENVVYKIL